MNKHCSNCGETKSIEDFSKNKNAKDGYCNWCKLCDTRRHWRTTNGGGKRLQTDPLPRFWKYANVCQHGRDCEQCCWEWTAGRAINYGMIYWWGKHRKSHQISWELFHQQLKPKGLWILHHCDNPPCVNPHHLYAGTPKQNVADSIIRNRWGHRGRKNPTAYLNFPKQWGENHPSAKLTEQQVKEIIECQKLLRCGGRTKHEFSRKMIADRYGVAVQTIDSILYGNNWKHLPR